MLFRSLFFLNFNFFFPGLFSAAGLERNPLIVGIFSALARVFYHLQRFWSPAQAAAPRAQPASLRPCFSSIYGARPPQLPLKSALPGSVSGSRRQPRPAGAEPAAGPERQAPLGAPELGGGVREPPEEDEIGRASCRERVSSPV